MTQEELNTILKSHKKWLVGDKAGKRANLQRDAIIQILFPASIKFTLMWQ